MSRPMFVIAECGVNMNGRLDLALQLITTARESGADAVKFQAFTPDKLCPGNWERQAFLKALALTRDELTMCAAEARHQGIEFMCTPMDAEWLAFVVGLGVKRLKIGSGQNRDAEFLRACAETALPVIISNGMAAPSDFATSLGVLGSHGCTDMTALYCVSKYPTPDTEIHLSEITRLRKLYPATKIGFSSHCRSFWPCVAAAYAGAEVVEAHIALPGTTGPDIASSLLPHEFKAMVREVRAI